MKKERFELDAVALRDLIDGVSDLVQSVLPDGRIHFVNRAWLDRLGYAPDEVDCRDIFTIIHPDSRNHCRAYFERLLAGERVGLMEVVYVTKAGEPVHLEGKVTMAFQDGMPIGSRGVFREPPDDRRSDVSVVKLREQRRMFHSVVSILRGNTTRDRRRFLALVTRQVAQALDVARASVWLYDAARARLVCEESCVDGAPANEAPRTLHRADHPAFFEALEGKASIRAADVRQHPATVSLDGGDPSPAAARALLVLPLRSGDEVVGALCCAHVDAPRAWTYDEEEFGTTVAAIVLTFLENERRVAAESELQRLNAGLERRVEERTRQKDAFEQRLAYLLNSVPAVVFACEADGEFRSTFVSPNIRVQLGYSADEYLADAGFWRKRLHPDDLEPGLDALRRTMLAGTAHCEYRFRLPDGSYRWLRDDYMLMRGEDGRPVEIVGSSVDIHDRRVAEQAAEAAAADLRRLIETANAPIFGQDVDHRINEWNACAERITGYQRAEALGCRIADFAVPEHRDAVAAVFAGALGGADTANFEFPLRRKDGSTALLLLSASARRDANGAILGVVGVGQDITEHREAQRRNLRAQRLQSIGTLAGGVAHDVNNALAPILLATGMLRERHPESADLVDMMESSTLRGSSMVQKLLTFAKGVEGKRAPVRPQLLAAELEHIVARTFPKSIAVRFTCDPHVPAVVGDATQLHQVLLNLCVNARDAMPDGGRLGVEVARVDLAADDVDAMAEGGPGAYVRFRIADTGTGIAPDLLDRIFEPFFSTKSPEQGTGLGLPTSLGIVRSHGGFLRVQSAPGAGSTFSVYLPVGGTEATAAEGPPHADEPYRGRGQCVLLVDDEPIVRGVVQRLLVALGFTVELAKEGAAALAILRDPSKDVAIVITDLHMPGMDGLALTRAIRRLKPTMPVVLTSGFADSADPAGIHELQFAAQLFKPFGKDALTQTLRAALG